jgi:hypothetical protein
VTKTATPTRKTIERRLDTTRKAADRATDSKMS